MLECEVENYLIYRVDILGGFTRKCQWVGHRGAPDRVVFLKGAHFVELKRPGKKKADKHQEREHAKMISQGAYVCTLSDKIQVDLFLQGIMS